MTDSAIDAAHRVQSLIELTQSLSSLIAKENDLITRQKAGEIAPLQAEKARLAAAYAQSIRDIAANRSVVGGADCALLTELRAITETFEERAANQRALLEGAARAVQGVVKAVAEEAAGASRKASYGKNDAQQATAPISVNENA